jgi:quercetin dioxygenase-like cupin family protein
LLKTGDSYTFSARAAHSWDNPGEEDAEVLWSIVPPIPRAGSGTAVPATES